MPATCQCEDSIAMNELDVLRQEAESLKNTIRVSAGRMRGVGAVDAAAASSSCSC